MKKKIFLGCVVIMLIAGNFMVPYLKSVSLCRDIEAGRTEEAILKINNMKMVNCGTAPIFVKPILNALEYNIDLPLIVACKKGNYQIAEALLKKGADPNKYYKDGFTAVEAVIISNSSNELDMIKLLTAYDADVTFGESIKSPLFEVARRMVYAKDEERKNYFASCVMYLMQFDKQLIDDKGYSILYYAVVADNEPLIRQLLEDEKSLINFTTENMQTVLFEAVKNNSLMIVELLLENGADKKVVDSTGKTAYDYAVENGYEEIAVLLE